MKFIHISDLHIGKRLNEFLLLEDQEFVLEQVLKLCESREVDAILIAGDIYDRSVPTGDAIELFDKFVYSLHKLGIDIYIISGNHDSAQRLDFGNRIMSNEGVYIEGSFKGELRRIEKEDEFGKINFYLLPYITPNEVKNEEDERFKDYTEAIGYVIAKAEINTAERNIIVAHQFVTASDCEVERSDSELCTVGGLDNVDSSVFKDFDYVALGHIHGPQNVGKENIRYTGTLLKYSFSEVKHKKSITLCEIGKKGELNIELIPVEPKRDMVEIKGSFEEILKSDYDRESYVRAIITDEESIYDPMNRLRAVYPNTMHLEYANRLSAKRNTKGVAIEDINSKTPAQLFEEFYQQQNSMGLNEYQRDIVTGLLSQMGGEE